MRLPAVDDYLGKTVHIQALRKPAETVSPGVRHVIQLAGIAWKITEIDKSRNRVTVHSEGNWTVSYCRLDTFMRYVRAGDIVIE